MEDYAMEGKDFPDFNDGNLFDCIDFDDLFAEINDEDLLPDLEIDPELLAEFSASKAPLGFMENIVSSSASTDKSKSEDEINSSSQKDEDEINGGASVSDSRPWTRINNQGHDVISKTVLRSSTKQDDKGTKSSSSSRSKNPIGKKKMKVDWTPELHRRFVQAVEQLGVDKAVPSRILELMGIDCLTRHNIASHLQKYRSHRKHMLAREAEAASWNQKRHVVAVKRDPSWTNIAPTMGFPPVAPVPMPPHYNRPLLHVWGHPSVPDQSMAHTWSTNLSPPPHAWPPSQRLPPSSNPPFWHPHRHVPTQGTPCYPPHVPPMRFASPPPVMYKVAAVTPHDQKMPKPPCHDHPSKESVDAAVEDVLSKPWLPLPLGLKPPSMDSVMVELQSKGMPKIPPTTACA